MASEWQGGPNWIKARQFGSGKNNSGDANKRYGAAGTKRGRFNPNPTRSNHPGCRIAEQSRIDKANYIARVKGA